MKFELVERGAMMVHCFSITQLVGQDSKKNINEIRKHVSLNKVVRVDWLGNLTNYKKITMFLCFMLCARSQLGSFVLGVMLH